MMSALTLTKAGALWISTTPHTSYTPNSRWTACPLLRLLLSTSPAWIASTNPKRQERATTPQNWCKEAVSRRKIPENCTTKDTPLTALIRTKMWSTRTMEWWTIFWVNQTTITLVLLPSPLWKITSSKAGTDRQSAGPWNAIRLQARLDTMVIKLLALTCLVLSSMNPLSLWELSFWSARSSLSHSGAAFSASPLEKTSSRML